MGNSFTVVQYQRQHFGNQPGTFDDIEPDVPFAGPAKDFVFDCPNVTPDETAFLLFQSRDVSHARNIFQVNGVPVFGGLPVSPSRDAWNGNVLLVERHHRLRETGNVLHVESRNASGGAGGDIDDFIIDNVVLQYKTREGEQHGIFNVRSYGAVGRSEDNDHDGIVAAQNALNAAGGGVLFFPPGTYVVRQTIELGPLTTVLGLGPASVLLARPGAAFNMLRARIADEVRVRDLVLDGNRAATSEPDVANPELNCCGLLAVPGGQGPASLSISNVTVCRHHRAGIRVSGSGTVEIVGCRINHCGSRGVVVTRITRARIAGNVITASTQAGIQLVLCSSAIVDGNVIRNTLRVPETNGGHGIVVASSFDYIIVNNESTGNARWGTMTIRGSRSSHRGMSWSPTTC